MTLLTPLIFGGMMILPSLLMMRGTNVSQVALLDETGWAGPLLTAPEEASSAEQSPAKEGLEGAEESSMVKAGRFVAVPGGTTLDALKTRLLNGEFDGILRLETDGGGDLKATYYGKTLGNPRLLGFLDHKVNRAATEHRLSSRGLDPALLAELQKNVSIQAVKVEKGGATKTGSFLGEYLKAIMFSMLLYLLIVMYGWALMRGVMEEKTGKIAEVVLSAVRPFELLMGKVMGIASVGLLQYGIWFLLGGALYVANPMNFTANAGSALVKPSEVVLLVAYYLLGFVFYASIYAAMGAVVTTDQEAQQVNMVVVLCLIMPVMLMGAIMQNPNATWVAALTFVPFFAPTLAVMRASLVDVPLWQILGSLASLAAGTVLMAWLGGRIFRVGILMTGKRPSIPEILRWAREG
jgi:ABC-2 type transport system permease protein